jgi:hypothetical protein
MCYITVDPSGKHIFHNIDTIDAVTTQKWAEKRMLRS